MDDLAAAAAVDEAGAVVDGQAHAARAKRRPQKPAEVATAAPRPPALAHRGSRTVLDC